MFVLLLLAATPDRLTAWDVDKAVAEAVSGKLSSRQIVVERKLLAMTPEKLRDFFVFNRFPSFNRWQTSEYLLDHDKTFVNRVVGLHTVRRIDWLFRKKYEEWKHARMYMRRLPSYRAKPRLP